MPCRPCPGSLARLVAGTGLVFDDPEYFSEAAAQLFLAQPSFATIRLVGAV